VNYALTVPGKTERPNAGFARHEVPAGGARNAQVEPRFKGPVPDRFPFRLARLVLAGKQCGSTNGGV
jgi:hypothetical protein